MEGGLVIAISITEKYGVVFEEGRLNVLEELSIVLIIGALYLYPTFDLEATVVICICSCLKRFYIDLPAIVNSLSQCVADGNGFLFFIHIFWLFRITPEAVILN